MNYCPNCGEKINGNQKFCVNCSASIIINQNNSDKPWKKIVRIILDVLRYIFSFILIIIAFGYRDWRLIGLLIAAISFLPFIYQLLGKIIKVKYWLQLLIAVILLIIFTILEFWYIDANNLHGYICNDGVIVDNNCVSCPEGYLFNSDTKECEATVEKIRSTIKQRLNYSNIKDITVVQNNNSEYVITIIYKSNEEHLYFYKTDFINYCDKIISYIDFQNSSIIINMDVKKNDTILYTFSVDNRESLKNYNMLVYDANGNIINKTTDELKEDYINEYKKSCSTYKYKEIFRYAEDYKGKKVKFTGKVVQVIGDSSYRVNVTKDKWGYYDDTIFVKFEDKKGGTPRILEDDVITMYGTLGNLYTYTSVLGASITIPSMNAYFIDIK